LPHWDPPFPLTPETIIDETIVRRATIVTRIHIPHPPVWAMLTGGRRHAYRGWPSTGKFERRVVPADDPWPAFPVHHVARDDGQSDLQYEFDLADRECHARAKSVTLGVAQRVATRLGLPRYCAYRSCQRRGRCARRLEEDDYSRYPGPEYPPCADRDNMALLRRATERCLDALDEAIDARMRRHIGEPLSAVDHIGLTALPEEAILGAVAEAVDWLASRAGSLAEASARMGDGAANATDPPPFPS
jgi:hypothetical protein